MKLVVNGEATELDEECTVLDLLERLGLNRDGIAVAVDGQVVPRTQHATTSLRDGQAIEVIRAVGGG